MTEDIGEQPIEDDIAVPLRAVADAIKDIMPPGWGFTVLMFQFDATDGRMNYISSAQREDMLVALKEFIASAEGRRLPEPDGKPQ